MLTTDLIDKLLKFVQYKNLSLMTIVKISNLTRRNLLNDIDHVNEAFNAFDIEITVGKDEKLYVTEFDFENLMDKLFSDNLFVFQAERPYMVILYIFLKQDFVSVSHLQDSLKMSKNSILSDIQEANLLSEPFHVQINYSRKNGYVLEGNGSSIRKLIDRIVMILLKMSSGKWLIQYIAESWNLTLYTNEIYCLLEENEDILFVNERLENIIYLFSILEKGPLIDDKNIHLSTDEMDYIQRSDIAYLTNKLVREYPRLLSQKNFLTVQLLGVVQGKLESDQSEYFREILEEIIINVQGYIGSIFPNNKAFRTNLYNHLVPSYFRMKFQIKLNNPLKDNIIRDYPDLFYLIKRSFEPVAERLSFEVTDDEVAYFVMHFGSYFNLAQESKTSEVKAIILCPHGIGTSILLSNLLSSVMPEIEFKKYASESVSKEALENTDLIISTVFFESEKPTYLINPAMNQLELALLKRNIYETFNIETNSMNLSNELYSKIAIYTENKNALIIKSEMDQVVDENLKTNMSEIKNFGNEWFLTEEMIVQLNSVPTWQEAIQMASQPLLELGYISKQYVEAMIDSVLKYGPYIVLVPKVAIPHAKPSDGSQKLGVSLLQLKESVAFEDKAVNKPIAANLVFVLSIVDNASHLSILKKIYSLTENESVVSEIINAESKKDILRIISNHFEDNE